MREQQQPPAEHNDTLAAHLDDFYVRRINWLITAGRTDLIDEIADDCERRRSALPAADIARIRRRPAVHQPSPDDRETTPAASAAPASEAASTSAEQPPGPVAAATRIAVAKLRRSPWPAYRPVSEASDLNAQPGP